MPSKSAVARTASRSSRDSAQDGRGSVAPASCERHRDSVSSAPARFPLSTVETYDGGSGASVRVSCPVQQVAFVAFQCSRRS